MRASIGRVLAGGLFVVSSAVGLGFTAAPAGAAAARPAESTCGVLEWQRRDHVNLVIRWNREIGRVNVQISRLKDAKKYRALPAKYAERGKFIAARNNAERAIERIDQARRKHRCR